MTIDWEDNEEFSKLSLLEQVALLKATVTMPDVAELCGYDVEFGDKIRPPWNPTERTPSTHLYEDHYYDYGSGKHGDIFDFLHEVDKAQLGPENSDEPRTLGAQIWQLRRLALKGGMEPGDVEAAPVRHLVNLMEQLPTEWVKDLLGLNVTPYAIVRDPQTGIVYIPHWELREDGPFVYGVKLRHPNGQKTSLPGSQFTHRLYSPHGWIGVADNDRCIIMEGESDSWAMDNYPGLNDLDVFALPSGASCWKDAWNEDLVGYREVLLCFDNDHAGKAALDKVIRKVGYDKAKVLKVPSLYNDAREALAAGWEPQL